MVITITNPSSNGTVTAIRMGGSGVPYPGSLVNAQSGIITGSDSCGFASGGWLSITSGNNFFQLGSSLTGPSMASGTTCTFKVPVKSVYSTPSAGLDFKINNLKATSIGTTAEFKGTFVYKIPQPIVNGLWSPNPVLRGSTSRFTVTIKNTDNTVQGGQPDAMLGVGSTVTFGTGLSVASGATTGTTCSTGTVTTTTSSVTFSGGTVASGGGSCTFYVDITPSTQGEVSSNIGTLTSSNTFSGSIAAQTLQVYFSPPIAEKVFSPDLVNAGQESLLTIRLTNQTWNLGPLTEVKFSDYYPTGLVNTGTLIGGQLYSNTCGGTISVSGANVTPAYLKLEGSGGTISQNGSCQITVWVKSASAGSYVNSTGNIQTYQTGTDYATAQDTLDVVLAPPSGISSFAKTSIVTGETTRLTITLTNPNLVALTGVSVMSLYSSDGAGFVNAPNPNGSTDCPGGSLLADPGDVGVLLDGSSIPTTGCHIYVDVIGIASGTYYSHYDSMSSTPTLFDITSTNAAKGTGTRAQLDISGPDFRIVKRVTSISSPCLAGACQVTFTLSVDIVSGSGFGTSFEVTDVLPSQLTYVSSSTAAGSISNSSGTVTWTYSGSDLGIIPGAAAKTATITATVNTATQISNTGTISAYSPLTDPVLSNNTDTTTFQASAVALTDFRAEIGPNGTVVVWETALEVGAIGFFLFRKDEATKGYVPVGTGPVLALIGSPSGGTYRFGDPQAPRGIPLTYVLVEQEANGDRVAYGPFLVDPFPEGSLDAAALAATAETRVGEVGTDASGILTCFFDRDGNLVPEERHGSGGARRALTAEAGEVIRIPRGLSLSRAERLAASEREMAPETDGPLVTAAIPFTTLAGTTPIGKLSVKSAGLKYVSATQLVTLLGTPTFAVDKQLKKGKLALSYMGNPVSWFVSGNGIYFYGEAGETAFSTDRVYLAAWGDGEAMNGDVMGIRPGLVVDPTAAFPASQHVEKDLIVNLGSEDPATDYWHWDYVLAYGSSATKSFEVVTTGARATGTATMKVKMFGGSDFADVVGDHRVEVRVNGTLVGSGVWEGLNWYDLNVSFNASLLRDGASNTVDLTALVGPGIPFNLVYLDSIDVTYPRNYQAVANSLFYTATANDVRAGGLTVSGFTTSDIVVLNIATSTKPVIVTGAQVAGASGAYRVTFPPAAAGTPYLVTTLTAATAPDSIQALTGTTLKTTANSADYVIITGPGMETAAASLATLRSGQGWTPKTVLVSEIMDAFGSGNYNPAAIRDFLSYASTKWTKGPKAVVLAGDGSYDYRDILKYGGNLVPTMIVATPFGLAPSDNALVDFNGDGVPDIAIGRLAVLNGTELTAVVDKLRAYDAATKGTWDAKVVFSADTRVTAGVSNFSTDSDALATLKPAADPLDKVYLDSLTLLAARTKLQGDLTSGAGFVNFFGHATPTKLAPTGLLVAADVPLVRVGSQTPIVTAGTCFTNRFFDPTGDALGETLSVQGGGYGATAVFSSTGYSLTYQATTLLQYFYRSIWQKTASTIGDAARISLRDFRNAGGALYMTQTYNLLGDPATPVRYGK